MGQAVVKERRRCACRNWIEADPEVPGPDVLTHNRGPEHVAWRMGWRVLEVSDAPFPTLDGRPVTKLVRVA